MPTYLANVRASFTRESYSSQATCREGHVRAHARSPLEKDPSRHKRQIESEKHAN